MLERALEIEVILHVIQIITGLFFGPAVVLCDDFYPAVFSPGGRLLFLFLLGFFNLFGSERSRNCLSVCLRIPGTKEPCGFQAAFELPDERILPEMQASGIGSNVHASFLKVYLASNA